jgi:predicted chitinase
LKYIYNILLTACSNYQTSWCSIQAKPGKLYYGRGWFQLSYPCNYYNAGNALGLNLLANPDRVAQSERLAAATAVWYYNATGMSAPAQQGNFAATTSILNIYECNGHPGQNLQASRVATYQQVRKCFGLGNATTNLYC